MIDDSDTVTGVSYIMQLPIAAVDRDTGSGQTNFGFLGCFGWWNTGSFFSCFVKCHPVQDFHGKVINADDVLQVKLEIR